LNHASRYSSWFDDFVHRIRPACDYFIEANPKSDLSAVIRPRSTPLLTPVETFEGIRHVWTTFSDDQIDLDFSNPDVLFEFLDILLLYLSKGAKIIRLDAVAYIWKKIGTSCIHLPECHQMVKLFRAFLEQVAPNVVLITETNVPHEENIKYFGDGDEAHMIYQFTLPPILLHSFHSGSSELLSNWANSLADIPSGCTYFNFTASHDGIGLRPLEGLISEEDVANLASQIGRRGGEVSLKSNSDGTTSPYELNCTYIDALSDPDGNLGPEAVDRFLSSQAIAMALNGIPGIYFHNLVGTRNYYEGIRRYGFPRAINRKKWEIRELEKLVGDKSTHHHSVFEGYRKMLRVRSSCSAFHPDGKQDILDIGRSVFAIRRTGPDRCQAVVSVTNFSPQAENLDVSALELQGSQVKDLLKNAKISGGKIMLPLGRTAWLTAE